MTRATDQTPTDDPVLGLIAKRKAEALARAEKEHNQLASAARLYAQGSKIVNDAEEQLRKGRDKQDSAITSMIDAGLDSAQVAETLGITARGVTEATRRHRGIAPAPDKPKPAARRGARAKAPGAEPSADAGATDGAAAAPADAGDDATAGTPEPEAAA
jgi:hypothetical protein